MDEFKKTPIDGDTDSKTDGPLAGIIGVNPEDNFQNSDFELRADGSAAVHGTQTAKTEVPSGATATTTPAPAPGLAAQDNGLNMIPAERINEAVIGITAAIKKMDGPAMTKGPQLTQKEMDRLRLIEQNARGGKKLSPADRRFMSLFAKRHGQKLGPYMAKPALRTMNSLGKFNHTQRPGMQALPGMNADAPQPTGNKGKNIKHVSYYLTGQQANRADIAVHGIEDAPQPKGRAGLGVLGAYLAAYNDDAASTLDTANAASALDKKTGSASAAQHPVQHQHAFALDNNGPSFN